ncbi:PD-(D/E)XK motif protein [Aequorivita sp. SDUM287046]|uniref:PD-(D/E)XK motif protein n=1 Tax=Aequorivita aurantiaca TaxID=3053356 RepID=A0ABT8DKF8_9FLAO|nr:PD-(D/E)XK motif protein [Aequorivita aurantiaca]MDN3724446.1 PD-(D/E)XK motif protein [Aequorivita aurantiaca]
MKIIDLFDSLSLPENDIKVFNAIPIPEYPNFRVAIDFEGNAVLLLSVSKRIKDFSLKNFRLKYLQLEQNLECKIYENDSFKLQTFTVVTFRCSDRNLQEYFLRISETLVNTVGPNPTQQQVIDSLKKFVEVFKTLTDSPTNTVNGLWAELFLIENSSNPKELINYWHNLPEEKFDFNAGTERIEVKSSSNFERKHIFSAEQLNPPSDTQVLIASIFLKQHSSGNNIQYLIDRISKKIDYNFEIVDKLNTIVFRTLGSSLEHSIGVKFDYDIAQQSLCFYKHQDIDKIEEVYIPNNVSEVKYKSDLTNIEPLELSSLKKFNKLFPYINL